MSLFSRRADRHRDEETGRAADARPDPLGPEGEVGDGPETRPGDEPTGAPRAGVPAPRTEGGAGGDGRDGGQGTDRGLDGEPVTGNAPPPPDNVVVELRDVYKSFGPKEILKGVNLAVERGTSAVVLGGSGTGKSVLTKHVVGLLTPTAGEVWVLGDRVDLLDQDQLDRKRTRLGYLFQGGALFDSMTVYENMRFFLDRLTTLDRGEKDDLIDESLEDVNLPETLHQYPAELSGGQKKRVGLARTLILRPDIILYDEPTTGLDPVSVRVVSELIVQLRDTRGISSIAITHDLLAAEIITDQAHFLSEGRIVANGTLQEVRRSDNPVVEEFFKGTEAYGAA
ncbi:ABC transporter ATP-binding protein [Rubrivirga litoralis]|uniref:ATP-binding cassette domain-containing protein n=1 Tax=Rubrivirga litoralis TaxID=3075598 RepID=A0ABU3BR62_9BACT|nr:ATP-binding cassette domain-containing protein [Rubrivirga sp. F394]MDT0631783.1 ATP-binding cassette domain-containing protein [Rubrivirga sp. F394]